MRIISGSLKGTVLSPPKGLPVRPTTDRAKESLFNILANHFDFENVHVLDLFSGTGNISYECCSRGAASVVSVDMDFGCIQYQKTMKQKYDLLSLTITKFDVYRYIEKSASTFDIIFADAPYNDKRLRSLPSLMLSNGLLNSQGWLIVEHGSNLDLSSESGFFDKRIYGQSTFSFFKNPTSG